jgi:hypothetical protein
VRHDRVKVVPVETVEHLPEYLDVAFGRHTASSRVIRRLLRRTGDADGHG